jgi:hypothetical protein
VSAHSTPLLTENQIDRDPYLLEDEGEEADDGDEGGEEDQGPNGRLSKGMQARPISEPSWSMCRADC